MEVNCCLAAEQDLAALAERVLRAADRTNSAGDAFVKLQARGRQATVYPPEQFTLRNSPPSGTVHPPKLFTHRNSF